MSGRVAPTISMSASSSSRVPPAIRKRKSLAAMTRAPRARRSPTIPGSSSRQVGAARRQQEVGVPSLRDAPSGLRVPRQQVALDDRHPLESLGQGRRGRQSRQACAQHDRVLSHVSHRWPRSFAGRSNIICRSLDAMCRAMCSAYRPTPPISEEASGYRTRMPTTYIAGRRGDHAPVVHRLTVAAEDRQVDPAEVGPETGAPDHVRHLDDASVLDGRRAAPHADSSGYPLDPHRGEVLRVHPFQRRRLGHQLRSSPSADRRVHGEQARDHEPERWRQQAVPPTSGVDREVPGVPAGQPSRVRAGDLECDLGAGVSSAHHERRAVAQLGGIDVVAGVQLQDARVELGGEGGMLGH